MKINIFDIVRFYKYFDKSTEPDGCWNWKGGLKNNGYGKFWVDEKHKYAHIVSYWLYIGEVEEGKIVMHICDNPACVNPSHLKTGTHADNMRDRDSKGRCRGGVKQLSVEQVVEIRKEVGSQFEIAKKYNVSPNIVWRVRTGKSYKNIG